MPHDLLAAPFLGRYLLLRPGSADGVQLPRAFRPARPGRRYGRLVSALAGPPDLAHRPPGHCPDGRAAAGPPGVSVRVQPGELEDQSRLQLPCAHCYLGLKEFAGLPWPEKARLLRMMRDAGTREWSGCRSRAIVAALVVSHRGCVSFARLPRSGKLLVAAWPELLEHAYSDRASRPEHDHCSREVTAAARRMLTCESAKSPHVSGSGSMKTPGPPPLPATET